MTTQVRYRRVLEFASKAFGENEHPFEVAGYTGFEAVSQLSEHVLELVSRKIDVDFDALLGREASLLVRQPVHLSDGRGTRSFQIYGALASFEQLEKGMDYVRYRARLVPRLWWTTLTLRTRIFLDKTVPEIVEEVLGEYDLGPNGFEFRDLSRPGPRRKYVVQYQETDFAFLSRLLENEGIFYFFDYGYGTDTVVFGDRAPAFPASLSPRVVFRPAIEGGEPMTLDSDHRAETVSDLSSRQIRLPAKVELRDYNPQTPSVELLASADVDPAGQGIRYLYGENYETQAEGMELAKIRAEEIACRKILFSGTGNVCAFQAGRTFTLEDHYRHDFNQEYLITEIVSRATQNLAALPGHGQVRWTYRNEFTAVPSKAPFRPQRLTPKPRIAGTMPAHVDADGDDTYAKIDPEGRYRVRLPFDRSDRPDGKASHDIRMAQPYSGPDYGFHFPLHKGAEVILTHFEGDPDRPVIAASVPNPEKKTPVFDENHTQCRIRTGSDNQLLLEDRRDGEQIRMWTPGQKTYVLLGQPHDKPVPLHAGASLGTEGTLSLQAKQSVTIGSGWYGPDESRDKTANRMTEISNVMGKVVEAAGALGAATAALAEGGLQRVAEERGPDALGLVAGQALANTTVSAQGRLACVAGGTAVVASASALDCYAIGNASLMSGNDTLVASMRTVSIVAGGGEIDVNCHKGPIHFTSQTGDITSVAHKNVTVETKTEDVLVTSERHFRLETRQGQGEMRFKQKLLVASEEEIRLVVGDSSITIDPKGVLIRAPRIHAHATEKEAHLELGAGPAFQASSSDSISLVAKQKIASDCDVFSFNAKSKVVGASKELDVTAIRVEKHAQYKQS